ncbi:FAD:protein FMN transferase [Parapedobacter sp. 10938]|uniref:FAD:protein FMN transferase n=1 Tax=Parapedobacter flavus TaxID=3110225 RepID=UPI002DBC6876|nr:FAD:protein FMN transferase [Parapedobacter sp. 10938]MEC3881694.1 FAD:protein FMN transferase [Parapedobacter sp. 10938]
MRYPDKRWCFNVITVISCWFVSTGAGNPGLTRYQLTGYAQGTTYRVVYYASNKVVSNTSIDSVLSVIDSSMSLYKSYSLINKVNGANGTLRIADQHFLRVLRRSFEIYRHSGGLFDITVAPLVQLWGFGITRQDHFPDTIAVDQVMTCVGMDKIKLRGRRLTKKLPCVALDMNGIAQGYSVDVMADHLEGQGVVHYLVELGGELRVKGPKPDGTAFRVGIERPTRTEERGTVIEDVVEIREGAITTAGSYRKFVQDGDRRVSHHINPKTGYPFATGIISATVYGEDAMTADGYDNVIMAMPVVDAISFVNRFKGMEVFIVYKDEQGSVRDTMSTGFKKFIAN